jgi:superoxide dismutase, Fe-Mn family
MILLPDLPYAYDGLAPVLSAATMRTHHDKHHAKYVEVVNALAKDEALGASSLENLIHHATVARAGKLFNNAAQAWNHGFFWNCMAPKPESPSGALVDAIKTSFGDLASLRAAFLTEGAAHFGSGWVWLVAQEGRLSVLSTHDADTVVTREVTPLLVCDVWEHAYYLDHRNDRAGFLQAWWDRLANWDFAQSQFASATAGLPPWRYPDATSISPHGADARHPLEDAVDEALSLLDQRPKPGSVGEQRLRELMDAIAQGHREATAAGDPAILRPDLDRRIREAARRVSQERPHGDDHWTATVPLVP